MEILSVEHLTWRPGPDSEPVLREVSLTVEPGDRTAIAGASGSGKSTLLRCIVGFERCDVTIHFRGELVGPENILELRKEVVLVPQKPSGVDDTVAGNLAFARDVAGGGDELQRRLMKEFDLQDLPEDREFERLSVGEQQRLCFVRAMTLEPDVLLLDEPTSALDEANVEIVERLVGEWLAEDSDRAALWVTHDREQSARVADRVLTLADGTLGEAK